MTLTPPEITVRIPVATKEDQSDNLRAVKAAFQAFGQVRLRVALDVYAPGTPSNPKARYFSLLNSSPTIVCRTPEAVSFALNSIRDMVIRLNGWFPARGQVAVTSEEAEGEGV